MNNNIELNLSRKDKPNYEIFLFTVFYNNQVFTETVNRNLKLKNLNSINIFVKRGLVSNFENDKINFIEHDLEEITYNFIFNYIFRNYRDKHCIVLRPDIFIENQVNLELLPFYLKNDVFLCISSVLVNNDGRMSKDGTRVKSFYSMSQDCWIFIPRYDIDVRENIPFNEEFNEIILNKCLSKRYKLVNDTNNFRVLCRIHDGGKDLRRINTRMDKFKNGFVSLPETMLINRVSVDTLISHLNMSDQDVYDLKCKLLHDILERHFRN